MKKIFFLSIVCALALSNTALALPENSGSTTLSTPGTEKTLVLPTAADHSPVISLGNKLDPQSGLMVEGYAFVHYASNRSSAKPGRQTQCYGFLASGAKWKSVEPWVVNPANTRGLDPSFVFENLSANITKWEDAADGYVGNNLGVDILGDGYLTAETLVADMTNPDGKNEVYFANVSDQNAIAITIVWGVFGGPTRSRVLTEWDQIYDDTDFDWSSSGELNKMDFESISTHELGHSVGMGDLYNSTCGQETMYGYAGNGETNKRDLNSGDIIGVNYLY